MKPSFCLLTATLLLSGLALPARAQWQTYTTANSGLHSNVVREVTTDENGHLWVATQAAVQRFDGTTWTTYTQAHGLDYGTIKCVAARGGVVWVGHDRGLSRFDGAAWTNFTNAADLPVGLFGPTDRSITDVVIGPDGTVWLAGSRGLGRYDGSTWRKYNRSNSGLQEEAITALALDEGLNTLWIGTNCNSAQGGVYALNLTASSWRYFNMAGRNCVHGLAVSTAGTVFVGTCNASGLTTIDAGTGTRGAVTSSGCVTLDGVAADPTDPDRAWVVAEQMGASPTPYGLLAYDGRRGTFVEQHVPSSTGLPSHNVSSVSAQRVGSGQRVWVGTTDRGLAVYQAVVSSSRRPADAPALALSPNPATETVEVAAAPPGARLAVYDNAGRLVYAAPVAAAPVRLDVRSWPAGLYHLRLSSAQGTRTGRLLKH
ncbi:T9SS type A sorting domain-containing protein [Hymenobacter edaphi]|uniref:Secretion system C-terminal sorting domain-containing protein n=1 Tax=Hymenobacter edaphi TaxID=2211146 RepID=A0A328BFE2_9BACT|nr:T9SS type A sorting domain-containing protein [Hymenobacter edaphi]RAK66122.1 hypothetical protein DLM85_15620 [Hymenobacter edaphi]